MDQSPLTQYGGSSSEGVHGASGMLCGLSLHATAEPGPQHPVTIARQSQLHHISENMRKMLSKHNNAYNVFQIPLKTIFIDAMKSVGIVHSGFKLLNCGGCFGVTITMLIDGRTTQAAGDLCKTVELAEESAIHRAFVQLARKHNIRLVDISARKQKASVRISHAHYLKVLSGFSVVNWIMKKWKTCMDNFSALELYTHQKMKEGLELDVPWANMLFDRLLIIKRGSLNNLESLWEKIKAVTYENNRIVAASRAQPPYSASEIATRKAYFADVDSLALFLKWLKLDECKYSAQVDINGLWIGIVEIYLSDGNHSIVAKHAKGTIAKAHNAAARVGISFLEELFNVDVAGYSHSTCVISDQETYVWKGLKEEVFMLGVAVLQYWEEMLGKLAHCINEQKKALTMAAGPSTNEMADLVNRLTLAYENGRESFKVAGAKFGSLN